MRFLEYMRMYVSLLNELGLAKEGCSKYKT